MVIVSLTLPTVRAAIAHIGIVSFPDSDIISPFTSLGSFLCFGVSIAHRRILSAWTKLIVSFGALKRIL